MVRIFRGTASYLTVTVLLVAAAGATDPTDELLLALKDWEAAAADVRQPLPDAALAAYHATHNAHELDAAAELLGPVSARRLVEEYRWTLARLASGDIALHGVPRDATTSLFFVGVDVVLDGTTHRPVSIKFVDGLGKSRGQATIVAVKDSPDAPRPSEIRLVAGVTEVPDEPAPERPLELESILKRWQAEVTCIQAAEIRFQRYVYDTVFRHETRGNGRLQHEAPNLGTYEVDPVKAASDTQPARSDSHGTQYTLQTERRMRYHWDEANVWIIDLDQQSYNVVKRPTTISDHNSFAWRFWSHLESPGALVPGVLDLSDEFVKRFQWKIVRDDARGFLLYATPMGDRECAELKLLQILIDRESFRTKATRVISSTGTRETTHVFQYESVNDHRSPRRHWVPDVSGLTKSSAYRISDGEVED